MFSDSSLALNFKTSASVPFHYLREIGRTVSSTSSFINNEACLIFDYAFSFNLMNKYSAKEHVRPTPSGSRLTSVAFPFSTIIENLWQRIFPKFSVRSNSKSIALVKSPQVSASSVTFPAVSLSTPFQILYKSYPTPFQI